MKNHIAQLLNCSIAKKNKPVNNGTMEQWNNFLLSQGFTLIELLVVIAVITMVMAVFFPNFMGARQRARDTQRKNDLAQIQKSMELYKLDQNPQSYPADAVLSSCGGCWTDGGVYATCAPSNLYMRKIPCDPGSTAITPYIYRREATDNMKYTLTACLENAVDVDRDSTVEPTCVPWTNVSYTVREP